jgi:hypothetical protein
MKKILVGLGCYGLAVASATAGEAKWSAETCKHLQEIRDGIVSGPNTKATAYQKAVMLIPVRGNIFGQCGGANQADIDAGQAVLKAGDPAYTNVGVHPI